MAGGFLALAFLGPDLWSLDAWRPRALNEDSRGGR